MFSLEAYIAKHGITAEEQQAGNTKEADKALEKAIEAALEVMADDAKGNDDLERIKLKIALFKDVQHKCAMKLAGRTDKGSESYLELLDMINAVNEQRIFYEVQRDLDENDDEEEMEEDGQSNQGPSSQGPSNQGPSNQGPSSQGPSSQDQPGCSSDDNQMDVVNDEQ